MDRGMDKGREMLCAGTLCLSQAVCYKDAEGCETVACKEEDQGGE